MESREFILSNRILWVRLTALWAFSESFLGGILHGFGFPFTGLILSSIGVICMSLIARYAPGRRHILTTTLLVILIKFALSPHTPVTAYIAVMLQGMAGWLFFSILPFYISVYILSFFALTQSALQKIIIMTLVFGKDIWTAIDAFLQMILKIFGLKSNELVYYMLGLYLSLHLLAALVTAVFTTKLVSGMKDLNTRFEPLKSQILYPADTPDILAGKRNSTKRGKWRIPFIFLLLAGLFVSYYIESAFFSGYSPLLKLLIRGVIVLVIWYLIVGPILLFQFRRILSKSKLKNKESIDEILAAIPEVRNILYECWRLTANDRKIKRIQDFVRFSAVMLLYSPGLQANDANRDDATKDS